MKRTIIVGVLALSLTTTLSISAFANDAVITQIANNKADSQSNLQQLSLNQAYEMTLKHNIGIKQAEADVKQSEEVRGKAEDNLTYLPTWYGPGAIEPINQLFMGLQKADIALQKSEKGLNNTKEQLAYDLLKSYHEALKIEKEKALVTQSLKIAQKDKRIIDAKADLGLESKFKQMESQNKVSAAEEKMKATEKKAADAWLKLNNMIGAPNDSRYELIDQPTYSLLDMKDENLEFYVNKMMSDNYIVWLTEQNIRMAQMDLDAYTYNNPNDPNTYKAKELDLTKAQYSADDTKRQLAETINSMYYSIKLLENQYNELQTNLKIAEEGLGLIEVKYGVGMAIESEKIDAEYQVEQLKKSIFDLTVQHEQLKVTFEKPWLLFKM